MNWSWTRSGSPNTNDMVAGTYPGAVESTEPFSVDFDPRRAEKPASEPAGDVSYLDHVIEKALW